MSTKWNSAIWSVHTHTLDLTVDYVMVLVKGTLIVWQCTLNMSDNSIKIWHYTLQFRLFCSKLSFRMYEFYFWFKWSFGVYDFITKLFYCCRKSFEYLNLPKFQFVKLRKLSDLCSKIYEKSLSAAEKGIFKTIKFNCCQCTL